MNNFKKNLKIKSVFPIWIMLISLSIIFIVYISGLIINITPSEKKGIYIRSYGEIKRGDLVLFCLNNPYKKIGVERGYLEESSRCHGSVPLIKEVLAIPGDNVELTKAFIKVNEKVFEMKTFDIDSHGRKLVLYPRGNYFNTKGYWLIGKNALDSWDSRYWGYIEKTEILYKLTPLITW